MRGIANLCTSVALTVLFGAACLIGGASAQVAEFYKDKTITVLIPFGAGGGYDIYARVVASHMVNHIPGKPGMVMQYMPGAGGVKAANHFYTIAPKDGSYIALLTDTAPLYQVLRGGVRYDASRFRYLGSVVPTSSTLMVWHTAPATSLEQAKTTEVIFGATGTASINYMDPMAMRNLLGLKFKVVSGYKGSSAVNHAMERGEVHARNGNWVSWKAGKQQWITEKKIVPLAQIGYEKLDELPDVPLVLDLAKNDEQRRIFRLLASYSAVGRAFLTPPGIPESRLAALRAAFMATMKDPAFLAEARKRSMTVGPVKTGDAVEAVVRDVAATPNDLIDKTKDALNW